MTEKLSIVSQAQLDGALASPTAPDYVNMLFLSLNMVSTSSAPVFSQCEHGAPLFLTICFHFFPQIIPQYPKDLPRNVLSPLLTDAAIGLLERSVSQEENQLWKSLGDYWNIPRCCSFYGPLTRL